MDIIAILLGWPSVISALLFSAAGVWLRKSALIWTGVGLSLPMAAYLSAAPAFPFAGLLALLSLVGAALANGRGLRWQSGLGVMIYAGFLFALGYLVFYESVGDQL
jgi:hypothetical protein